MRSISSRLVMLTFSVIAVAMSVNAQTTRATNRQIQTLLDRIETKTDIYKVEVETRLNQNRRTNRNIDESIIGYISDFENATDSLKNDFVGRRANAAQVNDVLNRAWNIDDFMKRNRLGVSAENQWRSLRTDLDTLAGYYTVSWNWSRPNQNNGGFGNGPVRGNWGRGFGSLDSRITGTYTLNTSRSDNVNTILDRELGSFNTSDQDRFRRMLERRLASPDRLAIEKRGRTFTVASNLAEPVTVQTDNIAKTETTARGRTIRTRASANNSGVTISTEGDRANDFWLSFEPEGNDRLRVTRRLYLENQNRTISSTSVYDKTSGIAQWPVVDRRPDWNNTGRSDFYIPNGVQLTAVLQNRISTRASQVGDRFTMEVTSPSQYRGAIIEGRLAQVESSGRVSGRANVALEFDTLRMNGREYSFAGIIDSAREADGDTVNLTNEGSVRDGNQTKRTVTRAGIGAAIGALIGAVTGGGSGAAIGAGIGAGAGAGSVLIQGRDNLDLEQGSTFTITASAPQNVGRNFRP